METRKFLMLSSVILTAMTTPSLAQCNAQLKATANKTAEHMQIAFLCEPLVGDSHIFLTRMRVETIMLMSGASISAARLQSDKAETRSKQMIAGRDVTQLAGDPKMACAQILDNLLRESDLAFAAYDQCNN